jgi:Domain of unknown function (DUF4438), N-terminal/Domain of unknown function (DUF4438), C-terminal
MMKKTRFLLVTVAACLAMAAFEAAILSAQAKTKPLATNKDKLLTLAVQAQIAPAQPSRSYVTTWDGKPKMAIGTGGINYNLRLGDKVFGWASGDRATVGVSAEGGDERNAGSWATMTSLGNEVKVIGGEARGKTGLVVGKFGMTVLLQFEDDVLDLLAVGDPVQVKARGFGLELVGVDGVMAHHLTPELLEKFAALREDGKVEAAVVKEIPAEIVGQGAGGSSLTGNWHIQTCYPPDIQKYALDELRFGDFVFLRDTQTDYGKGYYKGGGTVGVVCSGPSDISGLGIGVTPVLSTRSGKIVPRLDPTANLAKYLGVKTKEPRPEAATAGLKTNRDRLIETAVQAVVQPARGPEYEATYEGKAKADIGMASINFTVSVGDSVYGWAAADHVEPDVTIQGRDRPSPSECAIAILGCIGNEARVVSGEARGARGLYLGRHAGSDDLVWFPRDVLDKLAINDKVQVKAKGVGLRIEGFDDVRVNKMSPGLFENLGIRAEGKELVVPVVMEVPGHIMGSGLGGSFVEPVDYDIQTTDPQTVDGYGLKKLRIGDLVAIRGHYDAFGRGRYEGAVTIGVCVHGFSDGSGHGPGLNPVLSALPGRIRTRLDPDANIAYALGIRKK